MTTRPPRYAPRPVWFLYLDWQWGILRRRTEGLRQGKSILSMFHKPINRMYIIFCFFEFIWITSQMMLSFICFFARILCRSHLIYIYIIFCFSVIYDISIARKNDLQLLVFTMLQAGRSRIYVGKGLQPCLPSNREDTKMILLRSKFPVQPFDFQLLFIKTLDPC